MESTGPVHTSSLTIQLFGDFRMRRDGKLVDGPDAAKARELLWYLLLFRDRSHSREALATMLWGDEPISEPKKYFRQVLWQLQTGLQGGGPPGGPSVLHVASDRVSVDVGAGLWLDVAAFDDGYRQVRDTRGADLDDERATVAAAAIELYAGDLLEGCWHEWCLVERERLEAQYLAMLDKLMAYCEVRGRYEQGLDYGSRVLRHDRARERTHRQLMRLHYLGGDRAAALRQYARCETALAEELSVLPGDRTRRLYEQIRSDRLEAQLGGPAQPVTDVQSQDALSRLRRLAEALMDVQRQVDWVRHQMEIEIHTLEAPPRG